MGRSRWEYSRIQILGTKKGILISVNGSRVSFSSVTEMLNSAGADGWEMVNMTTSIDSATGDGLTEFAMKRPLVSYLVPEGGVPFWDAQGDPTRPPAGQLREHLELAIESSDGVWALVRDTNGWRGWVDMRQLIERR